MNREHLRQSSRLASGVKRYHTWPTITQQTVGEHSFNMLRIWYLIWGPVPENISTHIIWHDLGELRTGDPPFPVKAENPAFKAESDRLEQEAVLDMGGPLLVLSSRDKIKVKICDLLEMWEFGSIEYTLGNKYAQPIMVDTFAHVNAMLAGLPERDQKLVRDYYTRATRVFGG